MEQQPQSSHRAKLRIGVAVVLLATAVIILSVLNQRQPAAPAASVPPAPPSNISSADITPEAPAPVVSAAAEEGAPAEEAPPPPVVGALPAPAHAPALPASEAAPHAAGIDEQTPAPARAATHAAVPKAFEVQLGVFTDLDNARQLQTKLASHGIPSHTETRVQVGPFKNRAEADQARAKLKALGMGAVIIAR